MKVKELERTVNIAWSPAAYHPILLAAGTAAQQLDASFNTTAQLELYSLNLAEPGLDLELKSSVPSPNRFHKLVWGGSVEKEAGIVVGGCDSGKLQIYNVNKVLSGQDGLVSHQDRHTGSVRALDFNPFQTNLLASGASESEIFIWDLNNTSTPMTPGAKAQPYEDVMSLAWNRQVQHILASTFATRCTVWDLRKNEPIIKLTDSNSRVRWRVVCWNPDVATQLCLASEEDSNPVVQLWDLRFATTPLKSLHSHTRGVLSLAWCAQDSDLLISTGKDNRIICWNPNSNQQNGEIQCEIGNTQQWIFELSWCPRNPNLIASCSADSHASIYNLTGASSSNTQTSNKIMDSFPGMEKLSDESAVPVSQSTIELTRPPRWMRKPAGANFSFGGKLVGFGGDGSTVTVSQVETDAEFIDRARNVLELINTGRASELCSSRQDPVWSYIEATFSPNPYSSIKQLLGYSQVVKEPDVDSISNDMTTLTHSDNILDDTNNLVNGMEPSKQENKKMTPSFIIPTGQDAEGSICKSLLCGDVEEAVNRCLDEGRSSDALVLAMIAGSTVLSKTQEKYFQSQNGSSHVEHLIRAIVTNDWHDFINNCNLKSWKEALVAVLTYARQDQIPSLCQVLGRRLEENGEVGELAVGADVCYITSGSISSIINKKVSQSNLSSPQAMQELVELVMVGEASAMSQGKEITTDDLISHLFTDYALLIASQGDYQTALSYLHHTQGEDVNDLRGRLDANMPNKQMQQGYQQQSYQQPRKFSSQTEGGQFAKMSPIAAMRSNAASAIPPTYAANDVRPPSHPPPSQSPSQHPGNVGKKYLVDPSVGGDNSNQWGSKYYPNQSNRRISQEMPFQPPGSSSFQPPGSSSFQPPASAPFQPPGGAPYQPPSAPFQSPGSIPGYQQPSIMNPLSPSSIPPSKPQVLSVQNYHTGKPGWNDPPVLTSSKSQSKTVETAGEVKAPITSPLAPPPPDMYNPGGIPGIPGGMPGAMPNRLPPTGAFQPPQSNRFAPPAPPPTIGAPNPPSGGLYGAPPMASGPPNMGSGLSHFSGPPSMGSMSPMAPPNMGSAPPAMSSLPPSMGSAPPMGPNQSMTPTPPGSLQARMTPIPQTSSLMNSSGGPPSQMGVPPISGPPPMGRPSNSGLPQMSGPSNPGLPPMSGQPNPGLPPMSGQPNPGLPPMSGQPNPGLPPMSGQPNPGLPPMSGQPNPGLPLMSGQPNPGLPPMSGQPNPGLPPMSGQPNPGLPPMSGPPNPGMAQMSGPPTPGMPPMSSGLPPHAMQRPVSRQSQAPTPVPGIPAANFHPPQSSSPAPQMNGGYGDPPTPRHVSSALNTGLPDNYKHLQSTLESLRVATYNSSNNPQVKRKLEDVARKLECLYEALRESRLSMETISNLEELVRECKEGNYVGALGRHTQLISGSDFSQISSFMPSIKVLIQTAMQLNVYLQ